MADFEKVYSINYDVSKALESLRKLEQVLVRVDTRSRELFQSNAAKQTFKAEAAAAKAADRERVASAKKTEAERTRLARQSQRAEREAVRATQRAVREKIKWAEREARERTRLARETQREEARVERQRVAAARKASRQIIASRKRAADATIAGLARMARRAAALGTVFAGLGARAVVKEFADFDQAITSAAAKFSRLEPELRPGTEGFKEFSREIRQAGMDTEHSAAAVARAMDFWAKAGKTSDQAKAALRSTLDFASANQDASGSALDVARAGDILSDTLGAFRLPAENAEELMASTARVADVMSAAANRANFSAEELFESFTSAGPTLTAVGSNIEETSALLAAMANAGIKGAAAGTQLKMSISNLSALTGPQEAALKKLGVSVKDADGNFRGLTTIIRDLNEATKDMGTADRFQIFAKAVGRRAIPSFINLLAEGKTNLDSMTEALRGSKGEANNLAAQMRQGVTKQFETFKNRVLEIGFQLADKTDLFGRFTRAINRIDFERLSKEIDETVIPALRTVAEVVKKVIVPAVTRAWDILSKVLTPALKVVSLLFGDLSEGGETMAKVLGDLIALWIAYKGYLIATKAIDMVGWLAGMVSSLKAAGAAQAGLATKTAATNATLMTSIRSVGLLKSAFAGLTAFVIGWEIGTLIHDKLVEPIMKARIDLKRLNEEFEAGKATEGEEKTKGVLAREIDVAKKKLEQQQKEWEEVRVEQRALGEDLPEKSERIRETEAYLRRLEARLNQQVNLDKYGKASPLPEPEALTPAAPVELEPWQVPEVTVMMPEPVNPIPQPVTPSGLEDWELPDISGVLDPDILGNIQLSLDTQAGDTAALDKMTGLMEEDAKRQETRATEARQFESQLTKSLAGTKAVTQNVNIGDTNIKVEAHGASIEDVNQAVRRGIGDAARDQKRALADGIRSEGPAEI